MYTSDNMRVIIGERKPDVKQHIAAKRAMVWLIVTIFTAFFGAVYEHFSFGVYSMYMLYAFAPPLLLGALPSLICALSSIRLPGRVSMNLCASAIATLTVGSIFTGVVEIYGTTNRLSGVYVIAGGALLALSILVYAAEPLFFNKKEHPQENFS